MKAAVEDGVTGNGSKEGTAPPPPREVPAPGGAGPPGARGVAAETGPAAGGPASSPPFLGTSGFGGELRPGGRRSRRRRRERRPRPLLEDLYNLPNLLTYVRILLIPVFLVVLAAGDPKSSFLAACLFSVAAVTDFLDGWLARKRNLVSMMGKFLDPLADKLIVMATLVMLVPLGRIPAWLVIVLLARETTITGLRSIASAEGMVIAAGYAGKLKTALQFPGIIGLLVHYPYEIDFIFFRSYINFNHVGLALIYISLIFSLYSAGEYFAGFFRQIAAVRRGVPAAGGRGGRDVRP